MAQNEKDEREELVTIKSQRLAGLISILAAALIAMAIMIDGYYFTPRAYDFLTVSALLMGVGALNNFIFSAYQFVNLKMKKRLADMIIFGAICLWSASVVIKFFLR